jgi:N-acetylmuramoyl-L-alanine amidase
MKTITLEDLDDVERADFDRTISTMWIHCSATKEGEDFGAEDINKWHLARGFNSIGYHYVILLNGDIQYGRDIKNIGAHVKGHNTNSFGLCYIGGLDADGTPKDTRTPEQLKTYWAIIDRVKAGHPHMKFRGHNEVANKACPCYSVQDDMKAHYG